MTTKELREEIEQIILEIITKPRGITIAHDRYIAAIMSKIEQYIKENYGV